MTDVNETWSIVFDLLIVAIVCGLVVEVRNTVERDHYITRICGRKCMGQSLGPRGCLVVYLDQLTEEP